jgi:DNA polymerase (family 10)
MVFKSRKLSLLSKSNLKHILMSDNAKLARQLKQLSWLKQSLGATSYEAAAYARTLRWLSKHPKLTLENIHGFVHVSPKGTAPGKSILGKILGFLRTGNIPELIELKKSSDVRAAASFENILGVGPKTVSDWISNGLRSPKEVLHAAHRGEIKLTRIQEAGLKYRKDLSVRIPREEIERISYRLARLFRAVWNSLGIRGEMPVTYVAGSYRRGQSSSGDIDIIAVIPRRSAASKFLNAVAAAVNPVAIIGLGDTRTTVLIKGESLVRQVDIIVSTPKELATMLSYFTGPAEHNERLRGLAKKQGMTLNQYGLFSGERRLSTPTERDIYSRLGLDYVSPANRR